MTSLAPIVLFVYNRPWHTQQTIKALQKNELADDSEIFIYSDAPKNESALKKVTEVREYIKTITGFKTITIIERESNWGLAASIIEGVTQIINQYGKIIVLEDDLITSPYFLQFMNQSLETFKDRDDIFSITGFSFSSQFMKFSKDYNEDIYLNIRPMSWSWASWADRWDGIDWDVKDFNSFIKNDAKIKKFNTGGTDLTDMLQAQIAGKVNSWYVRWSYHAILRNLLTIYPKVSFVNNLGHDNSGVHCGLEQNVVYSHTELNSNSNFTLNHNIIIDQKIVNRFNQGFDVKLKTKVKQLIKKILRYPS
jgi:hypothetical protein